jgi:hypothetical protein
MEEERILLNIESNIEEYTKQAAQAQQVVEGLKDALDRMQKSGETSADEIEATKTQLRQAQKEYRESTKSIDDLTKANRATTGSYEQLQAQLRLAEKNLKSQSGLLTKNADGTIQLSDAYVEASKEVENARNAVNEFNLGINNGSTNVGLYQQSIEKALGGIKVFGVDAGSAFKAVEGGLGGMVKAGISSLKTLAAAFLTNPIGIIILGIVGAVTLLVKAFQRSEGSMNKIKQVTGALGGVFSALMDILKPVVEFIADSVIVIFEKLGNVADKTMKLVSKGLRFLGFDEAAESVDNFTKKISDSVKAGAELAKMEAELQKAQRLSRKTQLEYQAEAEKLRQIRDDEANSIEKRIETNSKLARVLKKQSEDELAIANLAVKVAERRIQLQGETTANLDALAAAQTEVVDIQERILGQESEQLMNLNSLRRERTAYYKEQSDKLNELAQKQQETINAELAAEEMILAVKEQLRREARDKKRQAEAIDRENEMQLNILAGQNEFETRRLQLEAQRRLEIEEANKLGADISLIRDKYNALEIDLEQQKQNAKLAIYASFAGQIADLFSQQTVAGKIAAVAQTAINTYLGAQAAFAQTPGGIGIKSAAAALAIATGLNNIRKILAVDTSGKSTPSVSGGGSPRTSGIVAAQAGGAIAQSNNILPSISQNIGTVQPTQASQQAADSNSLLINAIQNLKVYTIIEEIEKGQRNKAQIEQNATF